MMTVLLTGASAVWYSGESEISEYLIDMRFASRFEINTIRWLFRF